MRVRVIEYWADVEGQNVPELFCLITDLDNHGAYPAGDLAAAYKWRWDGSETALREGKSALNSAGPSTGPMFRSRSPQMVRQEHAAWITATELVRGTVRAAARQAAPAGKGRRAGQPVHPREISFTAPAAPPHRRPQRDRHRQPAPLHHQRRQPRCDRRHRPAAVHHRPRPAPRP